MMTDKQIHELLASMSLEEKLGEMTQMAPNFFGTEDSVDLTGPMKAMNLRPEDVSCLGSTLNAFGAEKLIQMVLQRSFLCFPDLWPCGAKRRIAGEICRQ